MLEILELRASPVAGRYRCVTEVFTGLARHSDFCGGGLIGADRGTGYMD